MSAFAMARADPTDVMARRIGAYVIDNLIALVIIVAVAVPVFSAAVDQVPSEGRSKFCTTYKDEHAGAFCVVSGGTAYVLTPHEMSQVGRAFYAAAIGWTLLNAIVLQGITGGTIGKLLLGLRVVRYDGRRAGIGWCALRTVVLLFIDALCFIIGLAVALSTAGHRRVGDLVASTLVVPKDYEGQPIIVPGLTGPSAPVDTYGARPSFGGDQAGDGPIWDPARDAYIQYDRAQPAWVQWDEASKSWKPIDQG